MKPIALVQAAFVIAAVVVVVAFAKAARDGEQRRAPDSLVRLLAPSYTGDDRTAPDFDLIDRAGQHHHLDDLRGKVVVLHFFTRTCGPCVQELQGPIPAFEEMVKDDRNLAEVLVTVDSNWASIAPIIPNTVHGLILFDPTRSVVAGQYGTRLFPETWVIDRDGVIRSRFDHTIEWDSPLWINYLASLE